MDPIIEAGILFSPVIEFRLNGIYRDVATGKQYDSETYCLKKENGKYLLNGEYIELPLVLIPQNYDADHFDLLHVTIGINFHWERQENQRFKGTLKLIDEGEHLTAINMLHIEDYLLSVISSEMSANSSVELLKAHAVISRSWLLAQKEKAIHIDKNYRSCIQTDTEYVRWYDREDHAHFDVCADDHCQRYQGISKAYTTAVKTAIEATTGQVMTYDNKICDTRFSKCCGGVSERFDNTWEPVHHPYLDKVNDMPSAVLTKDLTREDEAREWILTAPEAFCNTTDSHILSNVLNDYDQETHHFFRWKVSYTTTELSALVKERIGIDFGTIIDLTPIERGVSGRIIKLKITGTSKTMIIGKELVIRKALSASHLYSSAFVVEKAPGGFTLYGAGWGHGVGLCQIGAAVMAAKGYSYEEILTHYFKGAELKKLY